MTKAYSFTKRLLAGAVVLFGVFTASNAGAETPPATEWTYDATAKTISSGGWTFAVSTGVTKTGADGTKTTGVSLAMTKTRNTGTADALRLGSPGIGAGAILGWTKNDTDLAGRRRVQGGSVDMGCYQRGAGMMIFVQ